MKHDPVRLLARLFCGLLITGGIVAVGAELFMWHWAASTATEPHDIQARGPLLWAVFAPVALLAGAICAAGAAYLASRPLASAGWVGVATGVIGAAGAIGLAVVAPGILYIGTQVPAVFGRWTPLVAAGAEIAVGVGLLMHLRPTAAQGHNADGAQAAV